MSLTTPLAQAESLARRIDDLMPQVRADLEGLVAIPSINFPGYDQSEVVRCAQACAELLRQDGAEPELVASSTGVPTLRVDIPGPPGSPTVLLYAHYDVQPVGDDSTWDSAPFTAEAPNESIHLGELRDSILAEALFLMEFGRVRSEKD